MTLRTLIYARVSTEDQVEKYGLPVQLRACREYAARHGFGPVIAEITDDGISGDVLERPGLDRVRQMVRDGLVDVVLMLDVDRLSRNMGHICHILRPEIGERAQLEFVAMKFEDTPAGHMFFNIRGSFAEYERELTRERTMRGRREKARSGLVVGTGRMAYGYRYEAGKLIPDPVSAAVVQQIYAWYDAGLSMRAITQRLREQCAPTQKGGRWAWTSVRGILQNETYAGVAYWGVRRRKGKHVTLRPLEERISIAVTPLVERAQWERVRTRLRENPHGNTGRPSSRYLLRGLLYCSCGHRMYGDSGHGNPIYRCMGHDTVRFPGSPCRVRVNAGCLDSAAWQTVSEALGDIEVLREMLQEHESSVRAAEDPGKLAQLQQQARRWKAREETALSLMLDPDMLADRAAIKQQHRHAQRERLRIEGELSAADRLVCARREDKGEWLESAAKLLSEYIAALESNAERQQFLQGVLSRADWDGEELTMRCFIGGKVGGSLGRCVRRDTSTSSRCRSVRFARWARFQADCCARSAMSRCPRVCAAPRCIARWWKWRCVS